MAAVAAAIVDLKPAAAAAATAADLDSKTTPVVRDDDTDSDSDSPDPGYDYDYDTPEKRAAAHLLREFIKFALTHWEDEGDHDEGRVKVVVAFKRCQVCKAQDPDRVCQAFKPPTHDKWYCAKNQFSFTLPLVMTKPRKPALAPGMTAEEVLKAPRSGAKRARANATKTDKTSPPSKRQKVEAKALVVSVKPAPYADVLSDIVAQYLPLPGLAELVVTHMKCGTFGCRGAVEDPCLVCLAESATIAYDGPYCNACTAVHVRSKQHLRNKIRVSDHKKYKHKEMEQLNKLNEKMKTMFSRLEYALDYKRSTFDPAKRREQRQKKKEEDAQRAELKAVQERNAAEEAALEAEFGTDEVDADGDAPISVL